MHKQHQPKANGTNEERKKRKRERKPERNQSENQNQKEREEKHERNSQRKESDGKRVGDRINYLRTGQDRRSHRVATTRRVCRGSPFD